MSKQGPRELLGPQAQMAVLLSEEGMASIRIEIIDRFDNLYGDELNVAVNLLTEILPNNPLLLEEVKSRPNIIDALKRLITLSSGVLGAANPNLLLVILIRDNFDLSLQIAQEMVSELSERSKSNHRVSNIVFFLDRLTTDVPDLLQRLKDGTEIMDILADLITHPELPDDHLFDSNGQNTRERVPEFAFLLNSLISDNHEPSQKIVEKVLNSLIEALKSKNNFIANNILFFLRDLPDIFYPCLARHENTASTLEAILNSAFKADDVVSNLIAKDLIILLRRLTNYNPDSLLHPATLPEIIPSIFTLLILTCREKNVLHNVGEETVILLSQLTQHNSEFLRQTTLRQPNLIDCLIEITDIANNPLSTVNSRIALLSCVANLACGDDFCKSLEANPLLINSLKEMADNLAKLKIRQEILQATIDSKEKGLDNPQDLLKAEFLKKGIPEENMLIIDQLSVLPLDQLKREAVLTMTISQENPHLPKLISLLQEPRGLQPSSVAQLAHAQAPLSQLP